MLEGDGEVEGYLGGLFGGLVVLLSCSLLEHLAEKDLWHIYIYAAGGFFQSQMDYFHY